MGMSSLEVVKSLFDILHIPFQILGYSTAILLVAAFTNHWVAYQQVKDSVIPDYIPGLSKNTFDFIVVGAGSSGAVVAYRLSESGKYSVLLLEAGGEPTPLNAVPLMAPFNLHAGTDWKYRTVPLTGSCYTCPNQRMRWPRGKVLGGTSILNFMLYVRGSPFDYDNLAQISKDSSWSYQNVLKFFKKSQDYDGNYPDDKFHGKGGPLRVSKLNFEPLAKEWVESAKELGIQSGEDYNGMQKPGFSYVDVTTKQGRRAGAYTSFIKPMENRRNVKIVKFAHVTKVILNDKLEAVGVTYQKNLVARKVFASKEVILSAGAIGTPQLLQLSGIGSSDHLRSVGISPILDLPGVGENLQDHVMTVVGPFIFNESVSVTVEKNVTYQSVLDYQFKGQGPLTFSVVSGMGFISSSLSSNPLWPDVQLIFSPLGVGQDLADQFANVFGLKEDAFVDYLKPFQGASSAFVILVLARPRSSGTLKVRSEDPFQHPDMDPKFFENYDDMKMMVEGMRYLMKVFEETQTWQKYGAKFSPGVKYPGCRQHPEKSDEYFECYIRHLTKTLWHQCCTAKFGTASDPMAVLHSNLSVKGVQGLRVVDASVMPVIPNANLNAPAIMIGEKASQMILNYWKNEPQEIIEFPPDTGGSSPVKLNSLSLNQILPLPVK